MLHFMYIAYLVFFIADDRSALGFIQHPYHVVRGALLHGVESYD